MRTHGAAVWEDLSGVFEDDHPIAEQAPALLRERRHDASSVVIERVRGRTLWLVLAHRGISGLGVVTGIAAACGLAHMTKHARYPYERGTFEQ
jgi:hypothetical protein